MTVPRMAKEYLKSRNKQPGISRKKRLLRVVVIVLAMVLLGDVLLCRIFWAKAKERVLAGQGLEAQCAIVFFSGFSGEGEEEGAEAPDHSLSGETLRRVRHGLLLLETGRVDTLICSGGNRPRENRSGARAMAAWLGEHGAASDKVWVEAESCDTWSNLRNSSRLMREKGANSALLVASIPHLARIGDVLASDPAFKGMEWRYSPYDPDDSQLSMSLAELWLQVHHDWLARALHGCLSPEQYNGLIENLRGCDPKAGAASN
ncbi:MAG: YdcF family protein [Desulfovibrio sp.]|nr:MAG: YdcF family protein [Desulfovibrio sp.]